MIRFENMFDEILISYPRPLYPNCKHLYEFNGEPQDFDIEYGFGYETTFKIKRCVNCGYIKRESISTKKAT